MKPFLGPLLVALVLSVAACSKPKPPSLTPRSAQVSAIKPDGVQLALVLAAHNPNAFPIVASHVSGAFELQDGTALGSAQSTESLTIPAEGDADLKALLDVRFTSMSALVPYALAAKPLPYRIRGSARLGGERLNVDVPFSIDGQLTPEQVMAAGVNGAANLLAPRAP
jgi:LEA14-like dessication related protein